jgi:hypothetical protein
MCGAAALNSCFLQGHITEADLQHFAEAHNLPHSYVRPFLDAVLLQQQQQQQQQQLSSSEDELEGEVSVAATAAAAVAAVLAWVTAAG